MNALVRWGKFNLVGAMGMVLQLAALWLLNRLLAGHYLCASAIAVELALLHNFAWHWNYTWRDRRDGVSPLRPLVRFHLSNGMVSILGNIALMRLLIHHEHLPLLLANGIAILCCSIANFLLGDNWAFAPACKADATQAEQEIQLREQSVEHAEVTVRNEELAAVGTCRPFPSRGSLCE